MNVLSIMYLSMVYFRTGGWGATSGKFDVFRFSKVNFLSFGFPLYVKIPPLGTKDVVYQFHNRFGQVTSKMLDVIYFQFPSKMVVRSKCQP